VASSGAGGEYALSRGRRFVIGREYVWAFECQEWLKPQGW